MMSPKNSGRRNFVVGLAGLSVVGAAMTSAANREVVSHAAVVGALAEMETANHSLNENIQRLKNFSLHSFDPIVQDVEVLRRNCRTMNQNDRFAVLRQGDAKNALESFCKGVEEKAVLADRFKTEHSLLRNSLSYFPLLVSQLHNTNYANESRALLADILNYNLNLNELNNESEIRRAVARMKAPHASKLQEQIKMLNWHANSILDRYEARADAENAMMNLRLTERLQKLRAEYMALYEVSQRHALKYYYAMAALCVGLMAWLLMAFRRLDDSGTRLQELNTTLEQKVLVRTHELSAAMEQLENNQQLLAHSAKMTALGEMAGGIAHEINTPLAAIVMNAGVLLERVETHDPEYTRKRLDAIVKIVERVSKIILGLRRFSRGESGARQHTLVREIIDDTLALCSEKLKANSVEVRVSLLQEDLRLNCTPEHISQVLLNFVNNSLDALKESIEPTGRWIQIDASAGATGALEISVTDAGGGLPESVQAKLMQPFFTTKPPGVGTGLGLSISKGIVEQHGGKLLYDRECANTRFVMKFPQAA